MTVLRPGPAVLAALIAVLPAAGALAHETPDLRQDAAYRATIPVDAMRPANRAAYLAAIAEELAAHGYDPGQLEFAIRAYQHDAGLPVDGVASKELLDHLKFVLPKVYAARAFPGRPAHRYAPPRYAPPQYAPPSYAPPSYAPPRYETPSYDTPPTQMPRSVLPKEPLPESERKFWPDDVTSEPLPDLPPAPSEEATLAPPLPEAPAVPPPPAEAEPPQTIGGVVSQVQAALKRRGYYPGPVTGRFDPETSAAVRRFQEDQGLPVDGVITPTLLNALEAPPDGPDGGSGKL